MRGVASGPGGSRMILLDFAGEKGNIITAFECFIIIVVWVGQNCPKLLQ